MAEKLVDLALKKMNVCPMKFLKQIFAQADNWNLERVDYEYHKLEVYYQTDKYIRDKKGLMQESTLTIIRTMKKHLLSFQDYTQTPITFDSFNTKFYESFVRYLTYDIPLRRRSDII